MNDAQVEQEVQAKGLNVAPRVTKERIDSLMARVAYTFDQPEGTTSTLAHAFLDGSFFLASGHSACVSKENFNAEMGQRMAKSKAEEAARNELWKLEGYLLYKYLNAPASLKPITWDDVASYEFQGNWATDTVDYRVKLKDGKGTWTGTLAIDPGSAHALDTHAAVVRDVNLQRAGQVN